MEHLEAGSVLVTSLLVAAKLRGVLVPLVGAGQLQGVGERVAAKDDDMADDSTEDELSLRAVLNSNKDTKGMAHSSSQRLL